MASAVNVTPVYVYVFPFRLHYLEKRKSELTLFRAQWEYTVQRYIPMFDLSWLNNIILKKKDCIRTLFYQKA